MKALSIKQPWAWLILRPDVTDPDERAALYSDGIIKDVENRSWSTKVRGEIAIHAGKSFDAEGYEFVQGDFPDIKMPKPNEFEMGGIVGTVRIVDCIKIDSKEDEELGSDWFFGEYGFVLQDAKPRPFMPVRGQLGFFEVTL